MAKKPTIKPGDKVTCLHPVEAYYSNYGGNPVLNFTPGMVGVVASIAPKVCIPNRGKDPRYDRRDEFVVVDYTDERNTTQRVGLNFCNIKLEN